MSFMPAKSTQQSNGFLDFMNAVGQAGASAAGTVAKGAGNLANAAGQAGSYLDPIANAGRISKTLTGSEGAFAGYKSPLEMAGQTIQQGTQALADTAEKASIDLSGGKQNQSAQWWGGAMGNVANTVGGAALGGMAGKGLLSKIAGAGGKSTAVVPVGTKATEAASKVLPKVAGFAGESLGSTEGVIAANEGRMASPEELATGAAIDVATLGAGKLLEKAAKAGLSKIPQFTPTTKAELGGKGLKRVGELMYKNVENLPLKGGREAIGEAMSPLKKKAYSIVTSNIDDAIKGGAEGATIDDLMEGVKKAVISEKGAARAGLSLDEVPKAVKEIDAMQDFYKGVYGTGKLDLSQIQQLKKNLRYKIGSGVDALISAKNQFKEGTRGNAQAFIEDQIGKVLGKSAKEAVKKANIDYNILKKLSGTLKKKAPYSGYLTDVISGSAGAASSLAQANIADAVKNAAAAVGLKRLMTAAAPKTLFAKIVKEGSKKQVNKFISTLAKGLLTSKD